MVLAEAVLALGLQIAMPVDKANFMHSLALTVVVFGVMPAALFALPNGLVLLMHGWFTCNLLRCGRPVQISGFVVVCCLHGLLSAVLLTLTPITAAFFNFCPGEVCSAGQRLDILFSSNMGALLLILGAFYAMVTFGLFLGKQEQLYTP